MKHLTFKKPEIIQYPTINGVQIDFHFTLTQIGNNYDKDQTSEHIFRIGFSTVLLIVWGENKSNSDKIIKMAYPFAESIIIEKIQDGTLKEFDEKIFSSQDNIKEYPHNIQKVVNIEGKTIEIKEPSKTIGEMISINRLADEIVQLRDTINTLFHLEHKEKLLFLNDERAILNFFRIVETEEEFTHRLASLGELIKNMNSKKLKSLVVVFDVNDGSISLLEKFIKEKGKENFNCIQIFRNIIRIRQGFPIHSDYTGIIPSLKYFGLKYPIQNFSGAWEILITSYKDALKELKEIIEE